MLTLNLNLLYTVVNILVLFVLLRKFLYRPVMNVIEQRQKQIDDAIADAEGKKNDAQAVLAQAQDKLQNVDTEAAQRREAYEKQAEKEKEQLLQDAQRQADAIVAEGKAAAEAEHARRLRDALFILLRAEGKPFCLQCSLFFLKPRCSRAAFRPAPAS